MVSDDKMSESNRPHQVHEPDKQLPEYLAANLYYYFELFVLTYQKKIKAFIYYNFPCTQQYVEDLLQEVFLNAYSYLSRQSSDDIRRMKLRPWLYEIAKNRTLNHCQRDSHFHLVSMDIPENVEMLEISEGGKSESPEVEMERKEIIQGLYYHIDQLSEPLRLAVYLHYIDGFEYKEIAEILDVPLNTVKSNGRRGILKLREMMRGEVR